MLWYVGVVAQRTFVGPFCVDGLPLWPEKPCCAAAHMYACVVAAISRRLPLREVCRVNLLTLLG